MGFGVAVAVGCGVGVGVAAQRSLGHRLDADAEVGTVVDLVHPVDGSADGPAFAGDRGLELAAEKDARGVDGGAGKACRTFAEYADSAQPRKGYLFKIYRFRLKLIILHILHKVNFCIFAKKLFINHNLYILIPNSLNYILLINFVQRILHNDAYILFFIDIIQKKFYNYI